MTLPQPIFPRLVLVCCLMLSACVSATLDVSNTGDDARAASDNPASDSADNPLEGVDTSTPAGPETRVSPPASSSAPRIATNASAGECAIFYAVMLRLASDNRRADRNVAEGCPPETDTGADLQSDGSGSSSALAPIFRRKLIERGTPEDIADEVIRSRAFANLALRS